MTPFYTYSDRPWVSLTLIRLLVAWGVSLIMVLGITAENNKKAFNAEVVDPIYHIVLTMQEAAESGNFDLLKQQLEILYQDVNQAIHQHPRRTPLLNATQGKIMHLELKMIKK